MRKSLFLLGSNNVICLTSDNFFIEYLETSQTLAVQRGGEKPLYFKVETSKIPHGRSLEAVMIELEQEIPKFKLLG